MVKVLYGINIGGNAVAEEVVTKFGKIVYVMPGLSYAVVNNAFENEYEINTF